MSDDAVRRRAERAANAASHAEAEKRQAAQESARAQLLVDAFVEKAKAAGIPTEELTAKPWSGSGRYKTGVTGWFIRRDRSVGVSTDGGYYALLVAPERFGRWRTVAVPPTPPPLQVGRGGRDGDSASLQELLDLRLGWDRQDGT